MIHHKRFIANKALDKQDWLEARGSGVTATEVSKASTPKGFEEVTHPQPVDENIEDNPYVRFGLEQEASIALQVKEQFGIMPNEWLIAADDNLKYMSTPDGLSLDHEQIAEIKTTGRDFGSWSKVPIHYRRQVQWQLYTTGAKACLFAWLLRVEVNGLMVPGWLEPKTLWVERDHDEMEKLISVADRLMEWKEQNAAVQS